MQLGTKLRILVYHPDGTDLKRGDIVVFIGFAYKNSMETQIKDSNRSWFLNKFMEGEHWEVVKE